MQKIFEFGERVRCWYSGEWLRGTILGFRTRLYSSEPFFIEIRTDKGKWLIIPDDSLIIPEEETETEDYK